MPLPEWIDHDRMRIPAPAEGDGMTGDGAIVIGEDDSRFARWSAWMELKGMERPDK